MVQLPMQSINMQPLKNRDIQNLLSCAQHLQNTCYLAIRWIDSRILLTECLPLPLPATVLSRQSTDWQGKQERSDSKVKT